MDITDKLLATVTRDAPVRTILVGAFWTLVVLDTEPAYAGLASTLRAETGGPWPPVVDAGRLRSRSGKELADLLHSERLIEASIGMAALNALLDLGRPPQQAAALTEANAEEIVIQKGTNKRVAVVGHFPFVDRLPEYAAEVHVLELRPQPGDVPADRAAEVLPRADVVALTGTSLLNHTFDGLIALCRPDAFVVVLGPSTPLSPVLFDAGASAVSGTVVADAARVFDSVGQGATFRQVKRHGGVRLLTWER
ncbi:MAG TPA: DUF364 domain-containing protein [Anaerolineae bacterium]|nr:DUF364 domain-containing protein [Anaerolineae bacterium]